MNILSLLLSIVQFEKNISKKNKKTTIYNNFFGHVISNLNFYLTEFNEHTLDVIST